MEVLARSQKKIIITILATTAGGVVILVLYLFTIVSSLKGEAIFWMAGVGVGAAAVLMVPHFRLILGFFSRLAACLVGEGPDPEAVLIAALRFPLRHASIGLVIWAVCGGLALLASMIPARASFSWQEMGLSFLGLAVVAATIWTFEIYKFKAALAPSLEMLILRHPRAAENISSRQPRQDLGWGLLVTVLVLLFSSLAIAAVSSYQLAAETLRSWVGNSFVARAEALANGITSFDFTIPTQLEETRKMLEPRNIQVETIYSANDPASDKSQYLTRTKEAEKMDLYLLDQDQPETDLLSRGRFDNGALLLTDMHDALVQSGQASGFIFDPHSDRILVFRAMKYGAGPSPKTFFLVMGYPWEQYRHTLNRMLLSSLLIIFLFGGVAAVVSVSMAGNISSPLRRLTDATKRLADGDLRETICYASPDELGELAASFRGMSERFKSIVVRLGQSVQSAETVIGDISQVSHDLNHGARKQESSVEQISVSMEGMDQTINSIAENVTALTEAAHDGMQSILEVRASMEHVLEDVESLDHAISETSSSTKEMIVAINQVAENAGSLKDTMTETSESIEGIDRGVREIDRHAAETATISREVITQAEAGAQAVAQTLSGNQEIERLVSRAEDVIDRLGQSAGDIGKIVLVIKEIASQINLLALNAAIIAAQSGEHGKGFAVVADEIKDLADRTTGAVREVRTLIHAVQGESEEAVKAIKEGSLSVTAGVHLSEQAMAALDKIVRITRDANGRVNEIAATTSRQAQASHQVRLAVRTVADMADQISQATGELGRAGALIGQANEEMERGSIQVRRATGEQMERSRAIVAAIQHITDMIAVINSAQQEQKLTSRQVVLSINNGIRTMSRQSLHHAEDMNLVVSRLGDEAGNLRELANRFILS